MTSREEGRAMRMIAIAIAAASFGLVGAASAAAFAERIEQIRAEAARREAASTKKGNGRLLNVLDDTDDDESCLICHL